MAHQYDYDNTLTSTPKSRSHLIIAAAYVNTALRTMPKDEEFQQHNPDSLKEVLSRSFATVTNLSLACEIALKGKLPDDKEQEIREKNQGHDLDVLFHALPSIEQQQAKLCVCETLLIDEATFENRLQYCKDGFIEWRYYYEYLKNGVVFHYIDTVDFLYSLVFYFVSSEGKSKVLEETNRKVINYLGNTGLLQQYDEIKKEYLQAQEIALKDGGGTISESDMKWLNEIKGRLLDNLNEIKEARNQYVSENTSHLEKK